MDSCCRATAAKSTSCARAPKDHTIVVRRYFNDLNKLQVTYLNRFNCFLRCHPQFCLWATRFSEYRRFLAWTFVPIDDCKLAVRFQCCADSLGKSIAIWNAMKSVRHKNKVRWSSQLGNIVSITQNEFAITYTTFHEAILSNF